MSDDSPSTRGDKVVHLADFRSGGGRKGDNTPLESQPPRRKGTPHLVVLKPNTPSARASIYQIPPHNGDPDWW